MRVTRLSAGCPAPVAPLPPQVSPRKCDIFNGQKCDIFNGH